MSIAAAPGISQILCISIDNSPLSGSFLADPGAVPVQALSAPGTARAHSFNPPPRPPAYAPATLAEKAGQYVAGARVQAAVAAGGGLRPVSGGWWAPPAPDAQGVCGSGPTAYAGVRVDVPPRACARAPALLSPAACEAWGSARLLSELRLATGPGKSASSVAPPTLGAAGDWVPVALGSVWAGSAGSGYLSQGSGGGGAGGGAGSAYTATPAGGCACSGVLTAIAYTVYYAGPSGAITGASADVVLANVTLPTPSECAAVALAPPLTVSVEWVDSAPLAGAGGAGAAARSGAPGYLVGAPVLSGVLVSQAAGGGALAPGAAVAASDRLAVARSAPVGSRLAPFFSGGGGSGGGGGGVAGLAVRGPGAGGECALPPPLGAAAGDAASVVPVAFGEDLAVSCTVSLTPAALGALCGALAGAPPGYMGFWPVNASGSAAAPTHVGTLGNAHPWRAWQWTAVSAPPGYPPAPVTYDAGAGVCSGVPATLAVEFLWAYVGVASNPQAKILGVRWRYISDSWAFTREDVRATGAGAPQAFAFATTVTWTQHATSAGGVQVAPPPNLVPRLPSDLWYPFSP